MNKNNINPEIIRYLKNKITERKESIDLFISVNFKDETLTFIQANELKKIFIQNLNEFEIFFETFFKMASENNLLNAHLTINDFCKNIKTSNHIRNKILKNGHNQANHIDTSLFTDFFYFFFVEEKKIKIALHNKNDRAISYLNNLNLNDNKHILDVSEKLENFSMTKDYEAIQAEIFNKNLLVFLNYVDKIWYNCLNIDNDDI